MELHPTRVAPGRVIHTAQALVDTVTEVPALPELRTQWEATRRHLERLLNEYPGKLLSRAIFKHPRSGMLTIHQTLDFMLDHVLHHQKQVERIAAKVG